MMFTIIGAWLSRPVSMDRMRRIILMRVAVVPRARLATGFERGAKAAQGGIHREFPDPGGPAAFASFITGPGVADDVSYAGYAGSIWRGIAIHASCFIVCRPALCLVVVAACSISASSPRCP